MKSVKNLCVALSVTASLLLLPLPAPAVDQPVSTPEVTAPAPSGSDIPAAAASPAVQPVDPAAAPPLPEPDQAKKPEQQLPGTLQLSSPLTRIGIVDLSRIERESKQGKAAEAKLKAKKEKLQAQLTAKQKQLEKQKEEIESQLPTLSPAERAKKAKDFEKKVDAYRKLVQKAESDMKPLVEEVSRTLSRAIKDAAAAYGKANGLAAVVASRELIFVGSSTFPEDVTDGVLQQINADTKP